MKKIYTSVLIDIKDIKERNKAFKKLSNKQKRQEIAFDCLNLLLDERIQASGKSCVYWSRSLRNFAEGANNSEDMQTNLIDLPLSKYHCVVCVRGGLMLSQIRLGNSVSPSDYNKDQGSDRNIQGFTLIHFHTIEEEYENSKFKHPYFSGSNQKLANICCNVIINGIFRTTDKTDYLTEFEIDIKY